MTHRPPGTFHPPTADELAADQQRRIHALEQRYQQGAQRPTCQVTATNPAPVAEGDNPVTGRWWPWRGALRLQYVIATATEVNPSATVAVRRGGVDVVTFTFVADGVYRAGHDEVWTIGDYLDLTLTGAVGHLVVQLHFEGEGGGGLVFSVPGGGGG